MPISDFTLGLSIAGGLVLAGVVAHGAWTARRNTPRQARPDADQPSLDPIQPRDLLEPQLDADALLRSGSGSGEALGLPPADKKASLDALIDVIAPIVLDDAVSGEAALSAMPATRRVGTKAFAIEGLNAVHRQWEVPSTGQRYDAFQAGVQLANRSGALNDIEYSEFVIKTQAFADGLNGTPEFPEMRDEVARARELDSFAGDHDAQLSFTVRARHTAWSPGFIAQNAARLGFVAGVIPGRMVLPASVAGMPPILGLGFDTQAALAEDPTQAAVREVTLSLDVPQVERAERPFVRMRESAAALAQSMDGVVTDDNGRPLAADAMDLIGSELEKLYDTLDDRDFSAGSVLARRLFS